MSKPGHKRVGSQALSEEYSRHFCIEDSDGSDAECSVLVAFKNPRDTNQISALARQIYPKHSKSVLEAFADATSTPHGYLLFDFKQSTDERYRLRANIFPGETQIVYLPHHLR